MPTLEGEREATEQVTAAARLLLTEAGRATAAQRQALAGGLARLTPRARVVNADDADAGLLDQAFPRQCRITGALAPVGAAGLRPSPGGRHRLHPAGLRWRGRIPYDRLQAALEQLRAEGADQLVRLKGLVAIEKLDGPLLIQAVAGQPIELSPLPTWPGGDDDSRLVVIAAGEDHETPGRWLDAWRRRLGIDAVAGD